MSYGREEREATTLRFEPGESVLFKFSGEWAPATVTQTWFPVITGEDQPRPGSSVRQVTFFASLHSEGNREAPAWPCPPGPRH